MLSDAMQSTLSTSKTLYLWDISKEKRKALSFGMTWKPRPPMCLLTLDLPSSH